MNLEANQTVAKSDDNPLHASNYADDAVVTRTTVVENVQLTHDIYRVRVDCPEIARRAVPGQFLMLRLAGTNDPLLGRPLALYDTILDEKGEPVGIDLVYLVLGKMTRRLANCPAGTPLEIWGPLGNGFSTEPAKHLVMVAGGIGQTPFLALSRERTGSRTFGQPPRRVTPAEKVTFCYGVRTREMAAGVADFEKAGARVKMSSDDGSIGHHGLVTDLLSQELEASTDSVRVVCCGPEPMLEAVAKICLAREVPCEVSLETPMACGIGICFSCVAKVAEEGGAEEKGAEEKDAEGEWDYKRTCVEGPVFPAEKLIW